MALRTLITPLGVMVAGATSKGLCFLEFEDRAKFISKASPDAEGSAFLDQVEQEIGEYFAGRRQSFTLPLDLGGTPFQESVWQILQHIPYGQIWSYARQAEVLGNPKAVRAVARANSQNPISIIIPCHRVIGSDGKQKGYAGGLERQKTLLDLEINQS